VTIDTDHDPNASAPGIDGNARQTGGADPVPPASGEDDLVEEDLLVEDVSIDGMCGVY
jgi:mycofactocin precursor